MDSEDALLDYEEALMELFPRNEDVDGEDVGEGDVGEGDVGEGDVERDNDEQPDLGRREDL